MNAHKKWPSTVRKNFEGLFVAMILTSVTTRTHLAQIFNCDTCCFCSSITGNLLEDACSLPPLLELSKLFHRDLFSCFGAGGKELRKVGMQRKP